MTNNSERDAVVSFTVTREYSLEGTFGEVARVLGTTVKALVGIIDEGDEWPDVKSPTKLIRASSEESEDITIDDITEV